MVCNLFVANHPPTVLWHGNLEPNAAQYAVLFLSLLINLDNLKCAAPARVSCSFLPSAAQINYIFAHPFIAHVERQMVALDHSVAQQMP